MTAVIDASVALGWLFELDQSARAQAILASGELLIAPDLVLAEITNAAWKFVVFAGEPQDAADAAVLLAPKQFDELVPVAGLIERR